MLLGLLGAWALGQELVVSDPHFQNALLFIIGSDIGIIFPVFPAPSTFTQQKAFSTCVSITSWFLFFRRFLAIDTKQCVGIETGHKRLVVNSSSLCGER